MLIRSLSYSLAGLVFALAGTAYADFTGPLDVPASLNTKVAQHNRLTAIARADQKLVAVGPRGHILISEDQGGHWEQVPVPVSSDLVAVQFIDANLGWAVGHDGVVLHSADGGRSWQKQLDGREVATIMGEYLAQLPETDAQGATSLRVEITRFAEEGADKPFLDVLFTSAQDGYVVGAFNLALRTRDGGSTWQPMQADIDNPSGFHLYAITQSAGRIYLAGERGLLLRQNPDTQRFEAVSSPYQGSYFGLLGTEHELVAYGLQGNAFLSLDGAQSWRTLELNVMESISSAVRLGDGRFAFATRGGQILISDENASEISPLTLRKPMPYAGLVATQVRTIAVVGSGGVQLESLSSQ